jgi:hypothetical protein
MTTLTVPADLAADAGRPRVPWRRMAWVTWRQHRFALAGVAVFLGGFAAYLWLSGLAIHHAYATECRPAGALACGDFTDRYGATGIIVSIFLQAVPALIGAFAGAPVLAREMETGTFRYAWTQGIGRWRWTLGRLVPVAVVVAAAAWAFSLVFSWYEQPFVESGYAIPFSTRVFDLTGVAFAAWTLAAFAIGALAGMLIRRVVPAIAATLLIYAGLALTTGLFLRQHYMTPVGTTNPDLPASAWAVSQWYTRDGKFAFPGRGSQFVSAVEQLCNDNRGGSAAGGPGTSSNVVTFTNSPAQCLSQHGYTSWTSYQPGSRFWPFQWIEAGWLLALSVLLIAVTVRVVRRRAA